MPRLNPYPGEGTREKLLREAREFQYLLQLEMGQVQETLESRMKEIEEEVAATGTYTQTFEEIEHGARVAWRNAPKCSNRKFWNELVVFDRRDATTNEAMWKATLDHLEVNVKCGVSKAFMTIFPAAHPETGRGPRIWNMQVIRYASYINSSCNMVGDPANLAFTDMLKTRFGWEPQEGAPNQVLPVVVQAAGEEPELFHVPEPFIPRVRIWHPNHPFLSDMNLEWYGIPAVTMLDLELGGLSYTCPLFNGWYTSYEVLRDLTDATRLNLLPAVAEKMGLDIQNDSSLWRDEAMAMLHEAVLYSFKHARVTMVDHHTLMKSFYAWYKSEMKHRGFCPGNWKWLIPPLVGSTFDAYLGLKKMTEYTLKPAYVMGRGWRNYEKAAFPAADDEAKRKRAVKLALTIFVLGKLLLAAHKVRPSVLLLYASSGGVTRSFVGRLVTIMKGDTQLDILDVGRFDISQDERKLLHPLAHCRLCLFLMPTYGNGQPPTEAEGFLRFLGSGRWDFTGVPFAVLGFGNSHYQRFCGGADVVDGMLEKAGGKRICKPGRCDEVLGREAAFDAWVRTVLGWLIARSGVPEGRQSVSDLRRASLGSTLELERFKLMESGDYQPDKLPVLIEFMNTKSLLEAHKTAAVDKSFALAAFDKQKDQEAASVQLRPRDLWFKARVKEARTLHVEKAADGFGRATVLVRLDMSKLRVPYKSGDHVAIRPPNAALEPQIKKFLKALGRDGNTVFHAKKHSGVQVSKERHPLLCEVLGHQHTLGNVLLTMAAMGDVVSPQACDQLADYAKDPDKQHLRLAAVNVYKHQELIKAKGLQWANIFEDFPSLKAGKVPLELLLMLMPVIRPRLYSVASSPLETPGELHLVVGRLVYKTGDGKKRLGVASNFFSKLGAKDEELVEVRFQVWPCTSFRLPPDPLSPLVMVATGTGLAPFRGFLKERLAIAEAGMSGLGPAALIVGCKNSAELLLREELEEAKDRGALTLVLEVFSREPGQPKCHVQDRIRQDSEKLKTLLGHPKCEVYLCGGSEMAADVKQALEDVSSGCFAMIEESGRLHEDLFGIVSVAS